MPKPRRIILIRHGQSEANADSARRQEVPDHRMRLTDQGREQARRAGEELAQLCGGEAVHAYVSPYHRTRETFAELRAASGLKVAASYEDPRIREQDFGHLRAADAHALIDAERAAFGTFFYRVPDGESGADV